MSRKKQVYEKITALYCRISLDDGGDNESMSISNQKSMLRDFAEKNGMFRYEYYVDRRLYRAATSTAPAFQRMIADIEAGQGRLRGHERPVQARQELYRSRKLYRDLFPQHKVRYIAITDGVDSLTPPGDGYHAL